MIDIATTLRDRVSRSLNRRCSRSRSNRRYRRISRSRILVDSRRRTSRRVCIRDTMRIRIRPTDGICRRNRIIIRNSLIASMFVCVHRIVNRMRNIMYMRGN